MTTRWARFARGWLVAGFSTFVAALSHVLGGGHAPGWLGVVLSVAFAGVVCVGLAGRTASLAKVAASVSLSQLIFHGLFSVGSGGGVLAPMPAAGNHAHNVAGMVQVTGDPVALAGGHGATVWVFHAAAAVVTVAALRHGDAALRRLLDLARLVVRAIANPVIDPAVSPPRLTQRATSSVLVPGDAAVLSSSLRLRGPPRLVARVA